jgi:hypothetical protein
VSNGVEPSVSFPLDTDGFLRRECPTCEREFKWHHSEDEGDSEPMADSGYFCPYCAVQAPPESWFTKPQQALVESTIQGVEVRDGELVKAVGGAVDEALLDQRARVGATLSGPGRPRAAAISPER